MENDSTKTIKKPKTENLSYNRGKYVHESAQSYGGNSQKMKREREIVTEPWK